MLIRTRYQVCRCRTYSMYVMFANFGVAARCRVHITARRYTRDGLQPLVAALYVACSERPVSKYICERRESLWSLLSTGHIHLVKTSTWPLTSCVSPNPCPRDRRSPAPPPMRRSNPDINYCPHCFQSRGPAAVRARAEANTDPTALACKGNPRHTRWLSRSSTYPPCHKNEQQNSLCRYFRRNKKIGSTYTMCSMYL